jgi:hypothetical protein
MRISVFSAIGFSFRATDSIRQGHPFRSEVHTYLTVTINMGNPVANGKAWGLPNPVGETHGATE